MSGLKLSRCRSCKAPIVWAVAPTGKRIPLNPYPVPNGNLVLRASAPGDSAPRVESRPDDDGWCSGYVSHFSDCPQAKTWRKERS